MVVPGQKALEQDRHGLAVTPGLQDFFKATFSLLCIWLICHSQDIILTASMQYLLPSFGVHGPWKKQSFSLTLFVYIRVSLPTGLGGETEI